MKQCAHLILGPTKTQQRKEELIPNKGNARDTLLPVNEKVSIEPMAARGFILVLV